MVNIVEVKTKKDRKRFIDFQNTLYKGVEQYVPTMMVDELTALDPKKNPAFEYCDMRFFLAEREGKLVGRIGAIINKKANEKWSEKKIRITRMDFIEDKEVFDALICTVEDWAKEQGLEEMVGPMGFCDLDKEGMLIAGFELPSMFITYYNYAYYPRFMEEAGFEKEVDWTEQIVHTDCHEESRLEKLSERLLKRYGFSIVKLKNKKQLTPYIPKVFNLINSEYESLYGVVPLTQRQMEFYTKMFLSLINLRYVSLVENTAGELVAFGITAPSLSAPMKRSNGRLFPVGWAYLLKALKKPKILDMYLVAVRSDCRNTGLNAVLLNEVYKRAQEDNIELAETGPQLETNYNIQNMWDYFNVERNVRRRRSWKKKIA